MQNLGIPEGGMHLDINSYYEYEAPPTFVIVSQESLSD